MKVSINGLEQERSEFEGETIGAILDSIVRQTPGSYIRCIWLDKREASPDDHETLQKNPSYIQTLEVELGDLKDLAENNLANALDYLKRLIPGFEKAAELFRNGNEQEANKYYLQILEGIDWFSQVVNVIMKPATDHLVAPGSDDESLEVRQEKLTDLMSQMLEANTNQDWVLLADLLEYEMLPYYSDWEKILSKLEKPN